MWQVPDAVILAGGAGLRLKSVTGDVPKPMAKIGNRPFLELLLHQLKRQGFIRVVISVGKRQQMIEEHFGESAFGLRLFYSLEPSPLGTGGGLRQSVGQVATDNFLALNGDSYTDVDLNQLVQTHLNRKADVTMAVIPGTRSDGGSVGFDRDGNVTTFAEKRAVQDASYLSAGIYILKKSLIEGILVGLNVSLEEQLFPEWLAGGKRIQAFVSPAKCVDIGTPERYLQAQTLLAGVELNDNLLRSEEKV